MAMTHQGVELKARNLGRVRDQVRDHLTAQGQPVPEDAADLDAIGQRLLDASTVTPEWLPEPESVAAVVRADGPDEPRTPLLLLNRETAAGRVVGEVKVLLNEIVTRSISTGLAGVRADMQASFTSHVEEELDRIVKAAEGMAAKAAEAPNKAVMMIRLAGVSAAKQQYRAWLVAAAPGLTDEDAVSIVDELFDAVIATAKASFDQARS